MASHELYMYAAGLLFCIGLYGVIVAVHLLRKIMAMNIMGGGVFLFLIAVARRNIADFPDPVPHAMVLTGIVVALSATGFAIALVRKILEQTGRATLDDESPGDSDS